MGSKTKLLRQVDAEFMVSRRGHAVEMHIDGRRYVVFVWGETAGGPPPGPRAFEPHEEAPTLVPCDEPKASLLNDIAARLLDFLTNLRSEHVAEAGGLSVPDDEQ